MDKPLRENKKIALVAGVTGQDGAYLSQLLLSKGYIVHGIKRRSSSFNTGRIENLYEDPHIEHPQFILHYGDVTDSTNLIRIVQQCQPDEIYNLAAQSHVMVSFETPEYTANADALGALRLLEAIRILGLERKAQILSGVDVGTVRTSSRNSANRAHPVLSTKPICGSQALCLLDHRQLSRSIWFARVERYPVQPRKSLARRNFCDAQDHARCGGDQTQAAEKTLSRQFGCKARLGRRPRIRSRDVADAAAGSSRRLRSLDGGDYVRSGRLWNGRSRT